MDSGGRYITAGQWHDEKFYTFTAPAMEQAKAPSYLLLGGMTEDADDTMPEVQKPKVEVY